MTNIIAPIVHMNGTSRAELELQLQNAYMSLHNAYDAMKRAAPNGRDYYPVPGLMERAVEQHMRRLREVGDVMDEIEAELGMLREDSRCQSS